MDRRLLIFARQMRHEPSPAEKAMWRLLRHRQLAGFRFRRQHILEPYVADFYCAIARVVIEMDGETHLGNEAEDAVRTESLESRGLRVMRFWNTEVFDDSDAVIETIYRTCVESVKKNPMVWHRLNEDEQITPRPRTE